MLDPAVGLTQVLAGGRNTYLHGNPSAGSGQAQRIAQYDTAMQYFGGDALGSVRQLYSPNRQVLATTRYDPFGRLLAQSGAATSAYGFTGEWTDGTGLVHLRARYYAPALGRFLTRDVWEGDYAAPLTLHRWNYTNANAVNYTDPTGHCLGAGITSELTEVASGGLIGLLNPLNAPRNYQVGQKAWEKCSENLQYAKEAAARGDMPRAMAYATVGVTLAQEGATWIHGWNTDIDTIKGSYLTRMYYQEPQTWFLRLRPEDLPELVRVSQAECRIGGTGLTIASFLTPGVMAVKGGLSRGLSSSSIGSFSVPGELLPASMTGQNLDWAPQVLRFKSFADLKKALGPAGNGKVWHHIVEQRDVNVMRFGAQEIHSTRNIVAVPTQVNQDIANYYSRVRPFTSGETIRGWLESQSFERQFEFGEKILQRVLHDQPLP